VGGGATTTVDRVLLCGSLDGPTAQGYGRRILTGRIKTFAACGTADARRWLARFALVPAVLVAFSACAAPARIAPGKSVTVYTTPRLSCSLTLTIAGRKFTHSMRYGWIKITMPARDVPGRVPVRVSCGSSVATGAFTVAR
jgi:hypothetical protein